MRFAQWEAAKEANLDLFRWETGGYPHWFMVQVMAWFNLHNLVHQHSEAASNEKAERDSKRKK